MTLKFESEILFDLMKRDGDDAPSDVLPYESELKEKYLSQVVGAYPKLQDYRPEWLNYNLYHHLPSDFPTESVTNVTSASFHNVVPYAYKSAILKGNTLVNVFPNEIISWECANSLSWKTKYISLNQQLKSNTLYTFIINVSSIADADSVSLTIGGKTDAGFIAKSINISKGINKFTNTTYSEKCNLNKAFFQIQDTYTGTVIIDSIMILEGNYTNVDIPYFTGMQSVKMPVLTTSNEDGTKTNILTANEEVELRGIGEIQDTLDCLTGEVTERIGGAVLDGSEEGWVYENKGSTTAIAYIPYYFTNPPTNAITNYFSLIEKNLDVFWNVNQDYEMFCVNDTALAFRIEKTKLKTPDSNGIKEWLSKNNLIIKYDLATPIIKTVDLTCINEQGENETLRPIEGTMHVNTSSQTLPPLLDMGVPVEATSQNLMSFANIVEEEK